MKARGEPGPAYIGVMRPDRAVEGGPPPGEEPILNAALAIGLLLLALQLWALTLALELLLAGEGGRIWPLSLVSWTITLGGLLSLKLFGPRARPPGVRRGPRVI